MSDARESSEAPLTIITPRRSIIVMGIICLVLAALGVAVFAVNPTATLNLILGIGAFGFFGVGGGIAVIGQWRRSRLLRVDASGIRLSPSGSIPWDDVDRVGSTGELLGIRLRRYDGLVASSRGAYTADDLKAARRTTGWDISWPARLLDRSPADAARAVTARMPAR